MSKIHAFLHDWVPFGVFASVLLGSITAGFLVSGWFWLVAVVLVAIVMVIILRGVTNSMGNSEYSTRLYSRSTEWEGWPVDTGNPVLDQLLKGEKTLSDIGPPLSDDDMETVLYVFKTIEDTLKAYQDHRGV